MSLTEPLLLLSRVMTLHCAERDHHEISWVLIYIQLHHASTYSHALFTLAQSTRRYMHNVRMHTHAKTTLGGMCLEIIHTFTLGDGRRHTSVERSAVAKLSKQSPETNICQVCQAPNNNNERLATWNRDTRPAFSPPTIA